MTEQLVTAALARSPLADVHRLRDGGQDLDAAVDQFAIRLLIVGPVRSGAAHAVVLSRPYLKVLLITADGHHGEVHEFVPSRRRLGHISEQTLHHALQEAAAVWPPVWENV